jgi:hypothetical protein
MKPRIKRNKKGEVISISAEIKEGGMEDLIAELTRLGAKGETEDLNTLHLSRTDLPEA